MKISGNTVLITGGATGIGFALAEAFVKEGNKVLICGRRKDKLENAKEKLPQIQVRQCDLSTKEDRESLCNWVRGNFKDLNILVNNAGIQRAIDLRKGTAELLAGEDEVQANFATPIHLSAYFAPLLIAKKEAAIVNVSSGLAFHGCGSAAGTLMMLDKEERDWNIVETKCVGRGDPYCEYKVVPGPIGELKGYLEAIDSTVVAKVHDRLMEQLVGFLVQGKPLPERPTAGNRVYIKEMRIVTGMALFSERYRMALRMGGAKAGKEVGEHLMEAGVTGDEAIKRVIDFMEYCKVGKINLGETMKMWENCESFGLETRQPSCNFTTGFLNGLFSVAKNQRVREIKCIAAGDPYCEWEIS